MPQRKDPVIPVRTAVVITPWPGASADDVEQLVTRGIERRVSENTNVHEIRSISRSSLSVIYVEIGEDIADTGREFDDIALKLETIDDLPPAAGPIRFIKDFGDTAALMLTVASPPASEIGVELRGRSLSRRIDRLRSQAGRDVADDRVTVVYLFAQAVSLDAVRPRLPLVSRFIETAGLGRDVQFLEGPGYIGWDFATTRPDSEIGSEASRFISEELREAELHPDSWGLSVIRDPSEAVARIAEVAGDKYSYRELDDFTELISRTFLAQPLVAKVTRSGVWEERVFLEYSQERLASYGLQPAALRDILGARNARLPGGLMQIEDKLLTIDASGDFESESDLNDVLIATDPNRPAIYLRDLVDVVRGYQTPPRFLNFMTWRDDEGNWRRSRAITLGIQMRSRGQIGEFGELIEETLTQLKPQLPEDLILARTSDQPRQVTESIGQFMSSLYQAVVLVVLVALVGFWQWRPTAIIAVSIPLSIAITFGLMNLLGLDLQQVSIASLIIALGLLVDDPIVATDAIQQNIARGHSPKVAAWLGPTKLARPMYFTTITNIVAYLPFLLLEGNKGRFLVSLPIVLACTLVASRLVAMTYVPLFGSILLKPDPDTETLKEARSEGWTGTYYRLGHLALRNRKKIAVVSLVTVIGLGAFFATHLKRMFFPKDFSYLSYVDVWLPEDAPITTTNEAAKIAEEVIRTEAAAFAAQRGLEEQDVLEALTTFVGGGGPRFWFSVAPEIQQLNYSQVIVRVRDKTLTRHLVGPLQHALSERVPGARVDVRELETGEPVGVPVSIRITGEDIPTLRALAEEAKEIFRAVPIAARVRDDWGAESFSVKLKIDPDRANLVGISNRDVALSALYGTVGFPITSLRDGDNEIPVVARLKMEERSQLGDLQNLYVYSSARNRRVPLGVVSSVGYEMQNEKVLRRNQFRTIQVGCFPVPGTLPLEVMDAARDRLTAFAASLPPGYTMEIGGEEEKQVKGLREISVIMALLAAAIYLALVVQFSHAIKPAILFTAIPFGMVGALGFLWVTGAPLGFMALLGIASLIGLITSQVIIYFDSVEEMRSKGSGLEEALLDSCLTRMRAVLVSVGSTVLGLVPLAMQGGPLWEPLTYAQIGGLTTAAFIILLLIPVLYTVFVKDLRLVAWIPGAREAAVDSPFPQPNADSLNHAGGFHDETSSSPRG